MTFKKKYMVLASSVLMLLLAGFIIALASETMFRVISTSPEGSLSASPDTLEIRFSKPLIGLQSVNSMENLPLAQYLQITPPLQGSLQFKVQDTLCFRIDPSSLKPNTRYHVLIKAGIKALDGSLLASSVSFTFENRRFALIGSSLNDNALDLPTRPEILFFFNMPLAPQSGGAVLVQIKDGTQTPVQLIKHDKKVPYIGNLFIPWNEYHRNYNDTGNLHAYRAVLPELKRNTRYLIGINDSGIKAAAGTLPLRSGKILSFHTLRPLAVEISTDTPLRPTAGIQINFRHGLDMEKNDLLRYVRITDNAGNPVALRQSYYYKNGNDCTLWPEFKPRHKYRIIIRPGIKDIYGQFLAEEKTQTLEVADYQPELDIPFPSDTMVESYGKIHYLPLRFVNLDWINIDIRVYHTPESYINDTPARTAVKKYGENINQLNKHYVVRLPLQEYLKSNRGIVRIHTRYSTREKDDRTSDHLLQFSGLSMTVKYGPRDIMIHVTRLQTGKPAGHARIEIWDCSTRERLLQGTTDARGKMTASLDNTPLGQAYNVWDSHNRLVFFASQGDDFCKLDGNYGSRLSLYNAGISYHHTGAQINKYLAHIFTPKGIYKKGEQVLIKGYVRQNTGSTLTIPRIRDFTLTVTDPAGTTILGKNITLSSWGSFHETCTLPDDPALGRYQVNIKSRENNTDNRYSLDPPSGTFLVEAFRPREFEATVLVGVQGKAYFPGTRIPVRIKGQYFYGGLMAGGHLKYKVTATPWHFRPADNRYQNFNFSSEQWLAYGGKPDWKTVTTSKQLAYKSDLLLDSQGEAQFSLTGESPFFCSARITIDAEIADQKRQSIAESGSAIIHQGQYYIGLRLNESFISTSDTLAVRMIALLPDGKAAGSKPLTARIYRAEWKNVRKLSSDGTWRWNTEIMYVQVGQFPVQTGMDTQGPAQLQYKPDRAGQYVLTVEGRDNTGNRITNTALFWVWGGSASWMMSDDQVIELVPDRGNYKPGDTAKIMVKSPYQKVQALVTVEREGVIDSFVTELVGSADIVRIPIKAGYQPNVFISVVLLQGRIDNQFPLSRLKDIYRPTVKIGYALLPVSSTHKQLSISINKDQQEYKPGDQVQLKLQVSDHENRPSASELSVFVVDEGVLSLIGYETPNPGALFHSMRQLLVRTFDNRLHILGQHMYKLKGETPGGGGGMQLRDGSDGLSSINARKVFKSIALQKTDIITDARGQASLSFKLPDNLTRFRIMAVAVDRSDRFGSAQAPLVVAKKLIIRPALPRFANLGDTLSAGLVVDNNSDSDGQVMINAAVTGGMQIKGPGKSLFTLPARQSREIRFAMHAVKAGSANFDFTAILQRKDGTKFSDRMEWKIPVQIPRIRLLVAKSAHLDGDRQNESITLPQDIWPGSGTIRMTAASTALVTLDGAVRFLYAYPYGCLEQRISLILPMVIAENMVKEFKLPVKQDFRTWTQNLLDELSPYQDRASGGFCYWPERQYHFRPSPYLSVQTFRLLHLARSRGYTVNTDIYNNLHRYLRNLLRLPDSQKQHYRFDTGYWQAVDIAVFGVLAETGGADRSYVHTLHDAALKQPVYLKAVLARALYLLDKREYKSIYRRLLRDIRKAIKDEGRYAWVNEDGSNWDWYRHLYLSETKTTANVLEALIAINPDDSLIPKLVAGLMRSQKQGHWRTTQENQCVIQALNSYFAKYEQTIPFFAVHFKMDAISLFRAMFNGRSLVTAGKTAAFADLPGRDQFRLLSIEKQGKGRLYYTLEMGYLPRKLPVEINRGFTLLRKVFDTGNGREVTDGTYIAGRTYRVELTVKTETGRFDVVVDDPLPAGFEAINPNLKSVSIDGSDTTQSSGSWWYGFNRIAMHDDRVCLFASYLEKGSYTYRYHVKATVAGRLFQAPLKAEEMYYPEIFGTGRAGWITIK